MGEFENAVMLTVGVLYQKAEGVSIKNKIETRLPRTVNVGEPQSALKRSENRGYLKSCTEEPTQEWVGRPKRYFEITADDKRALEHVRDNPNELLETIPKVALDLKYIG